MGGRLICPEKLVIMLHGSAMRTSQQECRGILEYSSNEITKERHMIMIQDIQPHHFSLDYTPCQPEGEDAVILFYEHQVLVTGDGRYPSRRELGEAANGRTFQFLFRIDRHRYFLAGSESAPEMCWLEQGMVLKNLRDMRNLRPMYLAFAGYTAWHLFAWYRNNHFCGRCGGIMVPGTDERKVVCPSCGYSVYPRINPCIIVAVHDGNRLLMTKYANRPVTWFVLIAGFVEIGETVEDTVRREVMEETGVKVKNIRYFDSQPWGVPGNLTLGFTAELDGSDEITVDRQELSEACWFEREKVPVPDDEVSITSALIHAFVAKKF